MQRIDSATASADENGTGKDGFTEGTYPSTPATQLTAKFFNQVQEEICNVIEVTKATPLSTSKTQLRDAMLTRGRFAVRSLKNFANPVVDVSLNAIIWTEELQAFVGVGSGSAFRSTDGVVWYEGTGMSAGTFKAIAFDPGDEVFVTIGNSGVLRRSVDEGSVWSAATYDPNSETWNDICWAESLGLFVAVGSTGTFRVTTATDGDVWANRNQAANNSWTGVCWSPELSLLVAVSSDGTNRVMTSPDGINWTSRSTPATLCSWKSVCWSPELSLFVAVSNGTTGNHVMTSPNGTAWTIRDIPAPDNWWQQVSWIPDLQMFVAIANSLSSDLTNGVNSAIMFSVDGLVWRNAPTPIGSYGSCFAWSPTHHMFVAAGTNETDATVNLLIGP